MRFGLILGLVLVVVAAAGAQQKSITFMRLGADILQQKVALQPTSTEARLAALRKLFADAGCGERITVQPIAGKSPNVFCTTRGDSDSEILVAVALDSHAKGEEAEIHWSDLALLPILAESIGSVPTRHKMVFAAFSGGHEGEDGGSYYLSQLAPEVRKQIDAVVALDHLGRNLPVFSMPYSGPGLDIRTGQLATCFSNYASPSPAMSLPIPTAAHLWKLPTPAKTCEFGAKLVRPFHHAKIPVITFTSPVWRFLFSGTGTPIREYNSKLDMDTYNKTYLFLSVYLLYLDRDVGTPTAQ